MSEVDAINTKLTNRKDIYTRINDVSQKENKITNNLLYYYDKNFDSYYDINNNLDNNIETGEKLVSINNREFVKKSMRIYILRNLLFLIIFNTIVICGHKFLHLYGRNTTTIVILISCIYYIYSVIKHIYFNKFIRGQYLSNQFANDSTSSIFKEAVKDIFPHYMTRNKCPKGCRKKHHLTRCPKNTPNCQEVYPIRIKEMRTDSTLNNWTDGDILYQKCSVIRPADLTDRERNDAIKRGIQLNNRLMKCPTKNSKYIIMNEPQPWYDGIDNNINSNTIYECKWENVGKPIGDQGSKFNSKIPCDYYIGYKTNSVRIGGDKV